MAHGNEIVMCFPAHSTHKIQPSDVFMRLLSNYFSREVKIWLWNNPEKVATQLHMVDIFDMAYDKAETLKIAPSALHRQAFIPHTPSFITMHNIWTLVTIF